MMSIRRILCITDSLDTALAYVKYAIEKLDAVERYESEMPDKAVELIGDVFLALLTAKRELEKLSGRE